MQSNNSSPHRSYDGSCPCGRQPLPFAYDGPLATVWSPDSSLRVIKSGRADCMESDRQSLIHMLRHAEVFNPNEPGYGSIPTWSSNSSVTANWTDATVQGALVAAALTITGGTTAASGETTITLTGQHVNGEAYSQTIVLEASVGPACIAKAYVVFSYGDVEGSYWSPLRIRGGSAIVLDSGASGAITAPSAGTLTVSTGGIVGPALGVTMTVGTGQGLVNATYGLRFANPGSSDFKTIKQHVLARVDDAR